MEIVNLVIKNPKVISNNDMYMHPVKKTKNGRYVSFFTKTPKLKELQEFYRTTFEEIISDEDVNKIHEFINEDKSNGLMIYLEYGLPQNELFEHDVSNFIKALEDCLVNRIGIDDSRNLKVIAEKKLYTSEENNWILRVCINTYKTTLFEAFLGG